MALSNTAIKNAKPKDKIYKLYHEKGLYLEVTPKGSKRWRFKYRFNDKEKRISLGVYPDTSLAKAVKKRDEARERVADGIDPSAHKKAQKASDAAAAENSFETITREWHQKFTNNWTENHAKRILRRFEADVFPWIGKQPISEITAPELLNVIRRIESRGAIETAHRALQSCGQVFRYGVATSRCLRDISSDLKGAISPTQVKHHASITDPREISKLLRAIESYEGHFVTKCALKLTPLLFVRPGELRHAEWHEFDLENAEWRIPAEKMKARAPHIVPLSAQALAILEEIRPLTERYSKYVFPSIRSQKRPMSENTITGALRRLGYTKDEMTAHGFRSMASTLLNEQGWHHDAIERQLAHAERNTVRAAYNYAEYLPERRKIMQHWANYLEQLRDGAKMINLQVA